ncbi:MAG: hypothetical protein FD134_736 [Gallionellaceae bacterium]|nr:MAG: hypothetical protein FD134_736 [Gallionellaceae bacterium]
MSYRQSHFTQRVKARQVVSAVVSLCALWLELRF